MENLFTRKKRLQGTDFIDSRHGTILSHKIIFYINRRKNEGKEKHNSKADFIGGVFSEMHIFLALKWFP